MEPTHDDTIDERLKRLNEEFFERLESKGEHSWTEEARKRLIEVIETYLRLALNLPKNRKPCGREREKVEKFAKALREALLAYPEPERDLACLAFMVGYGEVPEDGAVDFTMLPENRKRMLSGLECLEALPHQGLPPKVSLKRLVFEVARVYASIGGNVTISPNGPFARVLMLVHEGVRIEQRPPKTPEALVRFAEDHRAEIQKCVSERRLALVDIPKNRP